MSRLPIPMRLLAVALVASSIFVATPVARAQMDPSPAPTSDWRIFFLESSSSRETAEVLRGMFGNTEGFFAFSVSRRNAIMVQGAPNVLAEVDRVIRELDVTSVPSNDESTEFIVCRHRRASDLVALSQQVTSDQLSVAFDDERNLIIAKGSKADIEALRRVVTELDVSTESWTVELHVLGPDGAPPTGGALSEVFTELEGMGIIGYGIVSQSMVRTSGDRDFKISEVNPSRSIFSQGRLAAKPNADRASLSLQVQIEIPDTNSQVGFKSDLKLKVGKRAIIGLAPTGKDGDKPLVLVLRARRN